MHTHALTLHQLGWRPFYSQQLTLEDLEAGFPARVTAVQRSLLVVLAECGERQVTLRASDRPTRVESAITVGDWVLVHHDTLQVLRVLERQSFIARMAAGTEQRVQSIAANVDTLFVVTSCNADFNLSRLERYLAVAFEARVTPVIVLTKADLTSDVDSFVAKAQTVAANVCVLAVNALEATSSLASLSPWLGAGQTVAFVGSSGVGKSSLINCLVGGAVQPTGEIRESDSRGRHTTTARSLLCAADGTWLIDTPGMRELKIGEVQAGLGQAFGEIEVLARQCRFRDCHHEQDDGCALRAAVQDGRLEARRLESYLKLAREAERASQARWQRHAAERSFGRLARAAQNRRRKETGRE